MKTERHFLIGKKEITMTNYDDGKLDNVVPRFGLLAGTKVTLVVLIGVWIIFLPLTIGAAFTMAAYWLPSSSLLASVVASIPPLFILALSSAILWSTTKRFQMRK